MSSIFRKDDNYVNKPKRNSFDMSHQNNLTLKFGELVPVMCQPVVPGDSVKIDPSFGLRFMPQKFPVQTRQRASIKYYYVRNRNLWNEWMDFIGKSKTGLIPPYIKFSKDVSPRKYLAPSKLADYLGVPIRVDVPYGSNKTFYLGDIDAIQSTNYTYIPNSGTNLSNNINDDNAILSKSNIGKQVHIFNANAVTGIQLNSNYKLSSIYGGIDGSSADESFPAPTILKNSAAKTMYANVGFALFRKAWKIQAPFKLSIQGCPKAWLIVRSTDGIDYALSLSFSSSTQSLTIESMNFNFSAFEINENGTPSSVNKTIGSVVGLMYADTSNAPAKFFVTEQAFKIVASHNYGLCWCDLALSDIPFCSTDNPDRERLSALPFRAIESVYNALIRNAENNPFILNGVPEYNKYLSSTDGSEAVDAVDIMSIKHCNWADDRFTTALPSPQQGDAPLVGLTGVNGATVNLATEDGTRSTVHLQVDAETGNVVMVDGVSSDAPDYLNAAMMSAVEYGITINDLRNVNSFQRWLENNIRRGYKYKDQLMAHYGVNARFDVLDMPEFIGGVSRDVSVQQITQSASTSEAELGEFGGLSSVMGQGHSIEHYCDEHGFIIGLMCVYPLPLYQDTLPKFFSVSDPFDFYFPEFGKIGMQPILNKEIAFSQAFCADDLNGTFGYQRAWYDSLENLDSVHGSFRFDLRNFLIARDFGSLPKLNKDFLTINVDDINNTFLVDDDEDKIIGQIYHHMSMKRPIPMIGIPALE